MGKKTTPQQSNKKSGVATNPDPIWSVQCGECFKWRVIPSQEEYEEIRSKLAEDPFICSKKPGISCNDPADVEYDDTCIWAIDKPNIPKTPKGFKRRTMMRKDGSKMDCFYLTPIGKKLRSSNEVPKFLDENPEYKKKLSAKDFSFKSPRLMADIFPDSVVKR